MRQVEDLDKFLSNEKPTVYVRGENKVVDKKLSKDKEATAELVTYLSEIRLIKDSYEIAEMQKAVDATNRGFADMVRVFDVATETKRGERVIEAAFFGRARV